MKKKRFILFVVLTIFVFSLVFLYYKMRNTKEETDIIALVNGILIDGTGKPPVKNAVIIIKNNIIEDIGNLKDITIPQNAKIINLKGKTMLPGIINAHVHIFYLFQKNSYPEYSLENWTKSGVTTILDLGSGNDSRVYKFLKRLAKNSQATRLITSGPAFTAPGGYPIAVFSDAKYSTIEVQSIEHAKEAVKDLINGGATVLKVMLESGKTWNQQWNTLSLAEVSTIIETAHNNGKRVITHTLSVSDLQKAINAKTDIIAHMIHENLPDKLIKQMIQNNIYLTPTIEVLYQHLTTVSKNPKKSKYLKTVIDNLKRFHQAGGNVALGTDFFGNGYDKNIQFGMPTVEMQFYQQAGLTNMEIIEAATKNAAYVCGMEDQLGTIEKGKIADIIVTNKNPLIDIKALKNLFMVIHNGEIIK